jgi:hypothetical protein
MLKHNDVPELESEDGLRRANIKNRKGNLTWTYHNNA